MTTINLGISSKTKYKIDFTLIPPAIILVQIAIFITQFSQDINADLNNLILLRIIHTVAMLIAANLVWQSFKRLGKIELTYLTLALIGISFLSFGDLTHGYLASLIDVELVSPYRRAGIILIQGIFWFPAIMIIGGNRKEIFKQFKEYENRLIAATRAESRNSLEFKEIQKAAQDRIRSDFYAVCKVLRDSINSRRRTGENLPSYFGEIAPLLAGDELRKFSRGLDDSQSNKAPFRQINKRKESVTLFFQQFRTLNRSIAQSTPLHMRSYALMLIALVTPPVINFYSITEFLISYPILILLIFVFAHFIVKTQNSSATHAATNTSIVIFVTGLLPATVNLVGQAFTHNSQTQFPFFITALALPITYYISMELLQVLRPGSLSLIRNDQLKASPALQKKVQAIVRDDFSQTLSHQWAVFIHGKTLTRLGATSLKLKAAALAGDTHTFDHTLEALLTSLENPDAEFEQVASDLQTELSSRLDPWRGFVDIKLTIAEALRSIQNPRVRVIGEVIEELLSNSIRHGKAKEIELKVTTAGDKEIDIIAVDDATIAPDKSLNRSGLGTRIFNLASDGRWSLTRTGSSTEFKLRMSIEK